MFKLKVFIFIMCFSYLISHYFVKAIEIFDFHLNKYNKHSFCYLSD